MTTTTVLEPAPQGVEAYFGRLLLEEEPCGCWAEFWENGPLRESGKCQSCQRREQFAHEAGAFAVAQAQYRNDYYHDEP